MKRSNIAIFALMSFLVVGSFTLVSNTKTFTAQKADNDLYKVTLDETNGVKEVVEASSGTHVVSTALGNDVTLAYTNGNTAEGHHINLVGGTLANTSMVKGLSSLTATFTGSLAVSLGVDDGVWLYETTLTSGVDVLSDTFVTYNYFKLAGSATITTVALGYSCVEATNLIQADDDTLFEAEHHMSNPSMYRGNPLAHGGAYVGGIDHRGWGLHFNYYSYVAGERNVEVYYTTEIRDSLQPFHHLYVNGVQGPKVVYSENTGWGASGFYTPAVATVTVSLNIGWNTLDLTKDGFPTDTPENGGYAEIDYIVVKGTGEEINKSTFVPLSVFKYEAEHGVSDQGGGNLPQYHGNASCGYWFGNLDTIGEWVELEVHVPVGRYELAICGGADNTRVANITTSESTADNHITFNSTGGWDQFKTFEDTVEVEFTSTSDQKIRITVASSGWYTLDYFTLTKI